MRRQVAMCLPDRGRSPYSRHRARGRRGRRGRPRAAGYLHPRTLPQAVGMAVARTRRSALAGRSRGGAGRAPCQRTSTWASGSIRPGMRGGMDDGLGRSVGQPERKRRAHRRTRGGAWGTRLRAGARRGAATQPYAAPRRRCGAAGQRQRASRRRIIRGPLWCVSYAACRKKYAARCGLPGASVAQGGKQSAARSEGDKRDRRVWHCGPSYDAADPPPGARRGNGTESETQHGGGRPKHAGRGADT